MKSIKKYNRGAFIRILVLSVLLAAMLIVMFIFGFFPKLGTIFVILLFAKEISKSIKRIKTDYYSENKKKNYKTVVLPVVGAVVLFLSSVFPYSSIGFFSFQYNIIKKYASYYNDTIDEYFPDTLPGKTFLCLSNYFPGVLQANSFMHVDFSTDEEGIREIKKYAEDRAFWVLDLQKYVQDKSNDQVKDYIKSNFNLEYQNDVPYYYSMYTGKPGTKDGNGHIYILYANGSWNHPHTLCITVNDDTNTVSFSY